jgi:hypothetical protein
MLTIEIDPVVLVKLKSAFPKPAGAAEKALKKYKAVLEDMIFKCVQRGRDNFDILLNLYSVPVDQLNQKGPHIGTKKIRLNKWLNDNGLALIKTVETGSNLTGLVSKVKCTEFMSIKTEASEIREKITVVTTEAEQDFLLGGDVKKNAEIFAQLYPDYFGYLSKTERDKIFDTVPVDVDSLKSYILWLCTDAKHLSASRLEVYVQQAMQILCIAKHTNGFYLQRKKISQFGRTYYQGVSVQNVNKTLRRAMLGNCWEYDLRSSVVAWKLNFARELSVTIDPNKDYRRNFWSSLWYFEARKEFLADVRHATFSKKACTSVDFQNGLIKEAITAISFGARADVRGWKSSDGSWTNPALTQILTNAQEREAFLQSFTIQAFIQEQAWFDDYLSTGLLAHDPELYFSDLLSAGKRPSRSKAVAYLYQQSETRVMDVARMTLAKHGIKPIANIHDAFIVRNKLSINVRDEMLFAMQDSTRNEFWRFKVEKLEGFNQKI